jgi:hypothetical protein
MRWILAMFGATLMVCATAAPTGAPPQRIAVVHRMGDGESRGQAKAAALDEIRLKAAAAAGVLVASSTTLKGDILVDDVRTISESIVKLTEVNDLLAVGVDGVATLTVSALTSVDETELRRRAQRLQEEPALRDTIRRLSAENAKLRSKLGGSDKADADTRMSAIEQVALNAELAQHLFEVGTLAIAADKQATASALEVRRVTNALLATIYKTPVQVEIKGVRREGAWVVALVKIGWTLDEAGVADGFSSLPAGKLLTASTADGGRLWNMRQAAGSSSAIAGYGAWSDVYAAIVATTVSLEVSAGHTRVEVPVWYAVHLPSRAGTRSCEQQQSNVRDLANPMSKVDEWAWCLSAPGKEASTLNGMRFEYRGNPVEFRMTDEDAQQTDRLRVRWLVRRLGKETESRDAKRE